MRVPGKGPGEPVVVASAAMLTFLMDLSVGFVVIGFTFHCPVGSYSGSAAILKGKAVQATFFPPTHDRVISPAAYRPDRPHERTW